MKGDFSDTDIGFGIRAFRKKKGFTLNRLAELTGIAASNLSSIELNKSSPTLNTLVRIARAFDMSPGEFLDEALSARAEFFFKEGARPLEGMPKGVSVSSLTRDDGPRRTECLSAQLAPGSSWAPVEWVTTDRLIYCLAGTMRVTAEGETRILEPGDGVRLRSGVQVSLMNAGGNTASLLLMLVRFAG